VLIEHTISSLAAVRYRQQLDNKGTVSRTKQEDSGMLNGGDSSDGTLSGRERLGFITLNIKGIRYV